MIIKLEMKTPNIAWENNNDKLIVGNFCSTADNVVIFRR
jgi:hypothetical protein